jgi:hypothetical protein
MFSKPVRKQTRDTRDFKLLDMQKASYIMFWYDSVSVEGSRAPGKAQSCDTPEESSLSILGRVEACMFYVQMMHNESFEVAQEGM